MELVLVEPGQKGRGERSTKWIKANYPPQHGKRFGKAQYYPPTFIDLPPNLSAVEVDQFLREQRVDELVRKFRANALEVGDPDIRDPSPAPLYDANGIRINSRETRAKREMEDEFGRLNRFLDKRIPGYMVPADMHKSSRVYKKIKIPKDIFPDVNFVAILVGPRGINHKRLQDESRCRIDIRGKDSSSPQQSYEESIMDQHVHIEGENDEDVEIAFNLVIPLMDPTSVEFRSTQASTADQMAIIAGTARCTICQGTGHTAASCPDAAGGPTGIDQLRDYTSVMIRCSICNGKGHLTRDCPQAKGAEEESHAAEAAGSTAPPTSSAIMIPSQMIGAFIGQGGSNIKRLMIESGCNIQVDQSNVNKPGVMECPLIFHGPKDALIRAKELCQEWLQSAIQAKEDRQKIYHQGQQIGVNGKFSDADAAANAVQMAYMQQLYWQQWVQSGQGGQVDYSAYYAAGAAGPPGPPAPPGPTGPPTSQH